MRPVVKSILGVLVLVIGFFAAAPAAQVRSDAGATRGRGRPEGPVPPVVVRTSVSRTAVWIGDRVVYTVELQCAPQVDVLADDLLKERLRVEGGEVVSAHGERTESDGRITHRMQYTLVTYRVDAPAMNVALFTVRYYTRGRGQRPGDAAPAGEVTIPPLAVAVRSALPESMQPVNLRPAGGVQLAPRHMRLAQPVGLGLFLAAIVPAAIWSLGLVRRARGMREAYVARRSRKRKRGSFDQIKSLEPSSDAERVDAYGQLDTFVRDHLSGTTGIEAHSYTPENLRRVLEERKPQYPHEDIEAVLAACELARYAPEPPSAAQWADAVRDAEGVLRATRQ
jgi:hypothetical protein